MADADIADMRIEVVKWELNQGALAGFNSTFDEAALAAEFRRGFEFGEMNQRLLCGCHRGGDA